MGEIKENNSNDKNGNTNLNEILTVPNILTFIRIILITPFVVSFLNENYILASVILAISGLSDCCDGFIARKLNQISAFGKILDPIADKLTLLAVVVCISILTPEVIPVMVVLVAKDLLMLIGGMRLIKSGCTPPPARWYGKVATLLFYISVCTIVFLKAVYQYENPILNILLLSVTTIMMLFALVKYYLIYHALLKKATEAKKLKENVKEKTK